MFVPDKAIAFGMLLDAGVAPHSGVNPVVLRIEIWVMMKLTQSLPGH